MDSFKIIGWTENVSDCDCCGKSGLSGTYCIEIDGEERYYGSTCATRNTKTTRKEFNDKIQADLVERVIAFRTEYIPIQDAFDVEIAKYDFWEQMEQHNAVERKFKETETELLGKYKITKGEYLKISHRV